MDRLEGSTKPAPERPVPTLYDPAERKRMLERAARLRPDGKPLWGRFTCPQMLTHVNDSMRVGTGEVVAKYSPSPLGHFPLQQLAAYWIPWPKNAQTSPELLQRIDHAEFDKEIAALPEIIDAIASREHQKVWPLHPAFGRLSARGWGVVTWRHTDHHFRQFGV